MIPVFPHFKKIELDDRKFLETFTRQFPPYNDFEFVSLWTYNSGNNNAFSTLHNNIIVKIQDFITGDFIYSFLGVNDLKDTISALLKKSKEDNCGLKLFLIPEINFKSSPNLDANFTIKEDRDSFDYIFSIREMAELVGSNYSNRRNHVSKFKKLYPDSNLQFIDLTKTKTKRSIKKLFFLWVKQKGKKRHETIIELTAIERLFDLANVMTIQCLGIYNQNRLIGFSTFHLVHDNYAILSFIKCDTSYKYIYEYLNHEIAKHLKTLGCTYLNYEQDLGIPSLRVSKMLWRPVFFLKKYTIEELPK